MTRLPRLSSRHRVTARLVVALVVLWFIGGFVVTRVVHQQLIDRVDVELGDSVASIAAVLESLPPEVLDQLADELSLDRSKDALLIYGADGSVKVVSADTDPGALPDLGGGTTEELRGRAGAPFTVGDVGGGAEAYRVMTAPLVGGGVVVSARSLDQVDDVMEVLGRVLLFSFLISVGIVLLLVWAISRFALRPLEDVVGTAEAIGAGNLDARVEVRSSAPDVERLADAMNNMLGRLQDAFAAKERSAERLRQFVGDASHELRTPLAAVLGYAELYQEHMARSPEQVDKLMDRIVAEGSRMQSLVEDLLLLARLDEGRPLERDAVDLRRTVDDAVSAIRVIDHLRTFHLQLGESAAEVVGDDVALRQIVDNLLANVVAHTPPGTTAHVSLTTAGDQVVLRVVDDGPGMTEEQRSHAFDRFWRAERARTRPGGSGLGLAIVAGLIAAQGGSIDVETAPGRGAAFEVRLPQAATAPA